MTTAELTTLRAAMYATYLAWVQAGCPTSYTTPEGKSVSKNDMDALYERLNDVDAQIAAASGGGFVAVQFRPPE